MQRRAFSLALLGAASLPALAQPAFREGQEYQKLAKPVATSVPAGQIEVLEFFSYACIHCFHFEQPVKAWLRSKPADVVFARVPVFHEPLQRAYYALEAIGQLGAAHDRLFALFHNEHKRPEGSKPEAVADWAAKAGVDRAKFLEAYQSFGVATKVKRASQLADAYQVEGTPAVGIAGRFLVPGQAERTLAVADFLIAQVRKG